MNICEKVIPLGLELGVTMGTDISSRHNVNVSDYKDDSDGNSNNVPGHVIGSVKPIYRTTCEGQQTDD